MTGPVGSGTEENEPEINELEWAKRHVESSMDGSKNGKVAGGPDKGLSPKETTRVNKKPVKLVARKTELRGLDIAPVKRPKKDRNRTVQELLANDSEVPYAALEKANREVICSLIERQDFAIEGLLVMITDIQYRLDDLEAGKEP